MMRRVLVVTLTLLVALSLGWLLYVGLPRWYGTPPAVEPGAAAAPTVDDARTIKVRLFYVDASGTRLTAVEREVPYAEQTVAQARQIVDAQLAPVSTDGAAGLVSAIPAGTTLRAIFVAERTAYVDLSGEVTSAHPGGSLNELLTIYTLVQALTTNLPGIAAVQILVDGKEVETLAGHVDIKRPLARADEWIAAPAGAEPAAAPGDASR